MVSFNKTMNYYKLFLILLFVYFNKAQSGSIFCLQSFNAFGPLYATETEDRFSAFLNELNSEKCDIIQLQEVWSPKQVSWVEDALSGQYRSFSPNKKSRIGIMSLSFQDITPVHLQKFRVNNSGGLFDNIRELANIKKAFAVAKTKVSNSNEEIYVLNTHLHHMDTPIRLSQLLEILDWRLKNQELKIVMNGDFNANPGSIEIRFIEHVLKMKDSFITLKGKYPEDFCTYCADNPRAFGKGNHVFDYIFYSNFSSKHPNTDLYPIYTERNLMGKDSWSYSDHYGMKAKFYLETAKAVKENDFISRNQALKTLMEVEEIFIAEKKSIFNKELDYIRSLKQHLVDNPTLFASK